MSLVQISLTHTFRNRILQSTDRIAFKRKVRGIWEEITYQEYYDFVQEICFSLLEIGVERGDRIALLSQSRAEWAFADMGILSCGAITVPIYQSNLASEVEYILKNSEAKTIFVENEPQLEKVHSIQKNVPSLKTIVI
ncbi:MAG: AMP-binding protein, partial [Deltaproteobacteria bacterium]|nr:AMP-binding protein [Deltaproteobacteria bacterium]